MKTSTKLQKIAKAIENYRTSSDKFTVEIDKERNTLKIISDERKHLFGYLLSYAMRLADKYGFIYFVGVSYNGFPYFLFHEPCY